MNNLKWLIKLFAAAGFLFFGFLSCGIEQYYYLPQPPAAIRSSNASATVELSSLSLDYADGYIIFYKIYLSYENHVTDISVNSDLMRSVNTALLEDYNRFYPLTDPSINTAPATIDSFLSRYYSKLEITNNKMDDILSKSGGLIKIFFPSSYEAPYITLNDGTKQELLRSNYERPQNNITSSDKKFFFDSTLLSKNTNENLDVASATGTGNTIDYAYVSMYVAAIGRNMDTWNRIISNPAFINIFIMPVR